MSLVGTAVRTVAKEVPAALRQTILYAHDPLQPLRGPQQDIAVLEAHRKPVVLVHGFGATATHLRPWRHALGSSVATYDLGYASFGHTLDETADCLAEQIRSIATHHGQRVSVAGHSLGGVLLCDAILRGQLETRVDVCLTVCSPHHGSRWAELLRSAGLFRNGSSLKERVTALEAFRNAATPESYVPRLITIAAGVDVIVPAHTALVEWADQILLPDAGHLSAIEHSATLRAVAGLAATGHHA